MRPQSSGGARVALALVAACVATSHQAQAQAQAEAPDGLALHIDCPALDGDTRVLLEARARAQLAAERLSEGQLGLACEGSSATVTWEPAGGERRVQQLSLADEPAAAVDALLDAIHGLVSSAPAVVPPPAPPAPSPAGSASERDIAGGSPPRGRSLLGALFGTDAELWDGAIGGAIGAHAGASVAIGRRWTLRVLGGPAWSLPDTAGLRALRIRAVARIDFEPLRDLQFGVGASGRLLSVSGPASDLPTTRTGSTAGALVSGRYGWAVGPLAMSGGPDVELLARPVVAELAGVEVFRVPVVVLGVSIDVSTP